MVINESPATPTKHSDRAVVLPFIIGLICVLFAVEQGIIGRVNNWWVDEFFALWASDRTVQFAELFRARIATDSNPPLYFSLLHAARLLIGADRPAVIALNAGILAVSAAVALALSIHSRHRDWVGLSIFLFVLGGPVAAYVPEARSYCLAMSVSYVCVVLASIAVLETDRRPNWFLFGLVGVVAGLSHVFAALLCCAVATAMFSWDYLSGRKRLISPTLGLAGGALTSSAVWMATWSWLGPGGLNQVSWISFTASSVREAGLGALELTYGTPWLALGFAGLLTVALFTARSRPLAFLIGVSVILFIAVPIAISFRIPIILTRYWLVGSPLLFASVALLFESSQGRAGTKIVFRFLAVGLIALGLPLSFSAAHRFVASKPAWSGTPMILGMLQDCGPKSIHVLGFLPGFALATDAPDATFVNAATLQDYTRPATETCPILGWSEHYVLRYGPGYMSRATPEELLRLLKLDYSPNEVVIDRHSSGFVVTRARH